MRPMPGSVGQPGRSHLQAAGIGELRLGNEPPDLPEPIRESRHIEFDDADSVVAATIIATEGLKEANSSEEVSRPASRIGIHLNL